MHHDKPSLKDMLTAAFPMYTITPGPGGFVIDSIINGGLEQEESEMDCYSNDDLEMTEAEVLDVIMTTLGEMSQSARLRTMTYLNSWNQEMLAEEDQEAMEEHYNQKVKENASHVVHSVLNGMPYGTVGSVKAATDAVTKPKTS